MYYYEYLPAGDVSWRERLHLPVLNEIIVSGWCGGGGDGGFPRYNSCDGHHGAGRVSGHAAPGPSLALTCRPTSCLPPPRRLQSPPGGAVLDSSSSKPGQAAPGTSRYAGHAHLYPGGPLSGCAERHGRARVATRAGRREAGATCFRESGPGHTPTWLFPRPPPTSQPHGYQRPPWKGNRRPSLRDITPAESPSPRLAASRCVWLRCEPSRYHGNTSPLP
ncbi:hypothetical protein E2C01_063734 [Portunus trituberculatus]|uniref:Uncharacterized protein n=1 Tax=Portunus trituberculatus TaxID=210409 RepID=A0A5B7HJU2_PORTR|nr:hypothetical protein [Portunus trituberculatus]